MFSDQFSPDLAVVRFGHHSGLEKSTVLAVGVDGLCKGGQGSQVGRIHVEPGRSQKAHQRITVGMVADHPEQGQDIHDFGPVEKGRIPHYLAGQTCGFQCRPILGHPGLGPEKDGHMGGIGILSQLILTAPAVM